MLTDLCEMDLDCVLSLRHPVDVFCLESIPCTEVTPIKCSCPCVLYWEKLRRMYIIDSSFLSIDLMYVVILLCGYVKTLESYST